jgi:dolichyl-phosphate-mannose-protein mannosyltransferase
MARLACLLAVLALAAFVRLDALGRPSTFVADEGFYARDACVYAGKSAHVCGISAEQTPEHPPLGKWLIALGIRVFGFDPSGWRTASALAGIATVGLLFWLGLRLLGSTMAATLAAGLLAVEPLHVVQSRVATLDVFVTMFGVAAVLFCVLDRDAASARLLPPWRLAAGAAAGAAVASKWSGVFALALVIGLTLLAERRRLGPALPSLALCLGLVPLTVYCASYAGRLHGTLLAAPWSHRSLVRAFVHRTDTMWHDQTGGFGTSSYQSPPWSWPLLQRPVVHYASVANGQIREILAVGSPLVWWIGFAAAVAAGVSAIRRRDWDGGELVIAAAVAVTFLPWLLLGLGRSFVFLYYMTPVVPFLCLAAAWAVAVAARRFRWAAPALAVASVLLLAWWWPVLTASPVSFGGWRQRVVFHDCRADRQPPLLPADHGGQPSAWVRLLQGSPPGGWCWV